MGKHNNSIPFTKSNQTSTLFVQPSGILVLVAVIVMVIKTREHLSIADFLDLNKLIDFISNPQFGISKIISFI